MHFVIVLAALVLEPGFFVEREDRLAQRCGVYGSKILQRFVDIHCVAAERRSVEAHKISESIQM